MIGRSDGELLDRFLAAGGPGAEQAFTALVERHGPMVWRVCHDVLRESNDADDAFQATFLVLARRAGAIRKRSSLGPWLYGVALRVARSARSRAARRWTREQAAGEKEPKPEESMADVDRLDAAPILHEEVGRLPEKYRAPLVLCYFEGLTHDQAASQLGWPVGTVRSRLAKARDRLRPRLLRRGVAPSVAILAASSRVEAAAAVPAALVTATVRMAVGAGRSRTVPAAVAALVGTTLREMTFMKTSIIATGLVAATLVGTAGVRYVAVAVAARPLDTEKAVTPKQNDPIPQAYAVGPVPAAIKSGRDQSNPSDSKLQPSVTSARVLWAKLKTAAKTFRTLEAQDKKFRIESGEEQGKADHVEFGGVAAARGVVEALAAELYTCADDLSDEVELLQAQLEIKKAEVQAAEAQLAKALESHKSIEKMADRKVISQAELRNSQRDVDIRSAELAKKQAEQNEVGLRIKQASRRRDEAIALVKRAKELVPEQEAPLGSTAPAARR